MDHEHALFFFFSIWLWSRGFDDGKTAVVPRGNRFAVAAAIYSAGTVSRDDVNLFRTLAWLGKGELFRGSSLSWC